MNRTAQGTQLGDRVLERQPEDLALGDTGVDGGEQCQTRVHTVNFTVPASDDAVLRRTHTFVPDHRTRLSTASIPA